MLIRVSTRGYLVFASVQHHTLHLDLHSKIPVLRKNIREIIVYRDKFEEDHLDNLITVYQVSSVLRTTLCASQLALNFPGDRYTCTRAWLAHGRSNLHPRARSFDLICVVPGVPCVDLGHRRSTDLVLPGYLLLRGPEATAGAVLAHHLADLCDLFGAECPVTLTGVHWCCSPG